MRFKNSLLVSLSLALAGLLPATGEAATTTAAAAGGASAAKPNIIFILADDFSLNLLGSTIIGKSMPNVGTMEKGGVSFANYFVTDSLCCPSRSSIFTGKLPHDTGVFTNTGSDGGFATFVKKGNTLETFAVALQSVGYKTAMMGKYLNGYEPTKDQPPQGWTEWDVAGNGYPEFNYDLNENGKVVHYGKDDASYLTDVVSKLGQDFIRKSASGPFFLEIATFAPHAPYIPAPRNANDFASLAYSQAAPWAARPDATAPEWLKEIKPLTKANIAKIDKDFRMRIEADEAVDKMIGDIRAELTSLGIDKNTYIVFSGDNGYHMGEYSLMPGKMTPFDTDIRVPLVIVGPGVASGTSVSAITENIDLCPTFTELGGASATSGLKPDGHSLVSLLAGAPPPAGAWRQEAIVEHHHPPQDPNDPDVQEGPAGNPPSYEALRTADSLYVEYGAPQNDVGYYDTKADPLELKNIAPTLPKAKLDQLHKVLQANTACVGATACWAAESMTP